MTARCTIGLTAGVGDGTWDDVHKVMVPAVSQPVYDGPCRLQVSFRPQATDETDQATADRRYLVAVPAATTGVAEQMTVIITAADHAPQAVGRKLTVQAIDYSNEQFELDLLCVEAEFQGVAS